MLKTLISEHLNVLLDLDGTLTDPYEGITACIEYALIALGKSFPPKQDLRRFIGPPLQGTFAALLGSSEKAVIEEAMALYRERFSAHGLYENLLYPGIPEALRDIKGAGGRLFLATSKPQIFAVRILEHFGLHDVFAGVHGSELDGTRSDKTELIAHILDIESLHSQSTVMVGDRRHDMIGAKANGVLPIGVLWGYGSMQELTLAGAVTILERPDELSWSLLDSVMRH